MSYLQLLLPPITFTVGYLVGHETQRRKWQPLFVDAMAAAHEALDLVRPKAAAPTAEQPAATHPAP